MATSGKLIASHWMRISDVVDEPLETLAPIGGYENMPLVSLEAAVVPLMTLVPDVDGYAKKAKQKYNQKNTT
jgi:hypothetical protein